MMTICSGCGEEFVWFCGGQVITYPMELDCPGCGAVTIDPGPPDWTPLEYDPPKLEQDWED